MPSGASKHMEHNTAMTARRVVITGIGVVSSIGYGASAFAAGLRAGRSGISPITSFDASGFAHRMAGEIKDFAPHEWLRRIDPAAYGRSGQFAAAAARMAVADAKADLDALAADGCGTIIGTTDGEAQRIDQLTAAWVAHGPAALAPELVGQVPANRLPLAVNCELGLQGESLAILTACAAGNYAIGHAFDLIQLGEADCMLCGGADSLNRKTFAGFYRLGAVAPLACQPFDKQRKGILPGEGAGMLLLETRERARARGARIYAEVLGYGLSCDANHMVALDQHGLAACIRRAHRNAGVEPGQIDYISAHGTATPLNDKTEVAAIRAVFGERLPPISSIKSMLGHTMGAASALAAAACALALFGGFVPPTINFEEPDPECQIDCVPNQAREQQLRVVQNNGFGFGGNNAVLILGRPQ